jgi:hypothetical protein
MIATANDHYRKPLADRDQYAPFAVSLQLPALSFGARNLVAKPRIWDILTRCRLLEEYYPDVKRA